VTAAHHEFEQLTKQRPESTKFLARQCLAAIYDYANLCSHAESCLAIHRNDFIFDTTKFQQKRQSWQQSSSFTPFWQIDARVCTTWLDRVQSLHKKITHYFPSKKKNGGITIFNTHTIINENQQQHVQILPPLESWRLCSTSPSHHASLMQVKILIDAAALGAVPPRQRG
jgi:hypothetical protein